MQEIILKVENVKKEYKLGQIGGTTLRDELQRLWAKLRKKEDPTRKIGTKNYNQGERFLALDGVSFEVKKGERVGIIGHNGAGKSTLLKLISRITAPTEGSISLNGRVASMLEVGTGFHPELTGRENIYMNGAILGMTKKEIDSKIEDIIEFSEVRQFIDTPVKRYSSGMYVKLAFSVAAHLDSEIMIMDEVLAVGDINFQQKCLNKMKEVSQKEDRTILYVSHNMNTIQQLCNRCIVLDKGKLVFDGDVDSAIAIYSKIFEVERKSVYDLKNRERKFITSGLCAFDNLQINNHIVSQNSKLEFRLRIDSKQSIETAVLRCVLFNAINNAVGTCYSQEFKLNSGLNVFDFSFPTNYLAPGNYHFDFILLEYKNNTQFRHDIINNVFSFKVNEDIVLYNMKWLGNNWGSCVLPTIEVKKIND